MSTFFRKKPKRHPRSVNNFRTEHLGDIHGSVIETIIETEIDIGMRTNVNNCIPQDDCLHLPETLNHP